MTYFRISDMKSFGTSKDKAARMMQSIAGLFDEGKHTDVTLVVGSAREKIPAHRIILISGSDYMRALLEEDRFADSSSDEIELPDLTLTGVKLVLNYVYKSEAAPNSSDDAVQFLSAAVFLQCVDLVGTIEEAFVNKVNVENCLRLWNLSEEFHLPGGRRSTKGELAKKARKKTLNRFKAVSNTEDFLEVSSDRLLDLLVKDALVIDKEEDLFEILMRWIQSQAEVPTEEILGSLFSCLRYGVMDQKFYDDVVVKDSIFSSNAQAKDIAQKGREDLVNKKETVQTKQRLSKVKSWEALMQWFDDEEGDCVSIRVTTDISELNKWYTVPSGGSVTCECLDPFGRRKGNSRWCGVDLGEYGFESMPDLQCIHVDDDDGRIWRFPYQMLYVPPHYVVHAYDDIVFDSVMSEEELRKSRETAAKLQRFIMNDLDSTGL